MGMLAALVCSRILVPLIDFPVLRPDCVVLELQVLHASPAAELQFAVKSWHRFGCTPVMGQRLPCRPLWRLKVDLASAIVLSPALRGGRRRPTATRDPDPRSDLSPLGHLYRGNDHSTNCCQILRSSATCSSHPGST
ncbi:hypothetical protein Q8A67_021054 [Cirrhinus molitorella]|uniref:Uncharacterized protein n=1 Tax=Cirrhinus molitorella TaxID=172907 RepID=A0AA88PD24_9TELE|nr:hypothetical protein Q8A67_021054 [Cirrhinus molitorella]